jgi:hypothetical protein
MFLIFQRLTFRYSAHSLFIIHIASRVSRYFDAILIDGRGIRPALFYRHDTALKNSTYSSYFSHDLHRTFSFSSQIPLTAQFYALSLFSIFSQPWTIAKTIDWCKQLNLRIIPIGIHSIMWCILWSFWAFSAIHWSFRNRGMNFHFNEHCNVKDSPLQSKSCDQSSSQSGIFLVLIVIGIIFKKMFCWS